jgi:hypothetical protein
MTETISLNEAPAAESCVDQILAKVDTRPAGS